MLKKYIKLIVSLIFMAYILLHKEHFVYGGWVPLLDSYRSAKVTALQSLVLPLAIFSCFFVVVMNKAHLFFHMFFSWL